jgi:hypothetical protein
VAASVRVMTPAQYIHAARAPTTLKPQKFGAWTIRRIHKNSKEYHAVQMSFCGRPPRTLLHKITDATMNTEYGDLVMEDSDRELSRHLPIWMRAQGDVLVTGLGLGCVVRGLLAKPEVRHIDVVEIDAGIIRVVGAEFASNPRVTLHHGNALTYKWPSGKRWDYAWHDLYVDEGELQLLHADLMGKLRSRVPRQSAWNWPRFAKRRLRHVFGSFG